MEKTRDKDRFSQLGQALDDGWKIEEPVLLGTLWRAGAQEDESYHFVLKNKASGKTALLSLPSSPQLLAFLTENNLSINAL